MMIQKAKNEQLEELMSFYDEMCRFLGEEDFLPKGNRGGFPSKAMVETAIARDELFVGTEDGRIMAACIMDHRCDAAYSSGAWRVRAAPEEVSVLHALRVHPQYSRRGYSRKIVEHAIQRAKAKNQKALRLDCIMGNEIPMNMYRSLGFYETGIATITYEDIGEPRQFVLFELALS